MIYFLAQNLQDDLLRNEKFEALKSQYDNVADISTKIIDMLIPCINGFHQDFLEKIYDLLYLKLGVHQSKYIKNVIYIIITIYNILTCCIVFCTISNSLSETRILPSLLP